jgi:secreted protein with Ig-like and vWFA domain
MNAIDQNNQTPEAPDSFTKLVRESLAAEPLPAASADLRSAILARLDQPAVTSTEVPTTELSPAVAARRKTFFQRAAIALISTAAIALIAILTQQPAQRMIGWNDEPAESKIDRAFSTVNGTREKDAIHPELEEVPASSSPLALSYDTRGSGPDPRGGMPGKPQGDAHPFAREEVVLEQQSTVVAEPERRLDLSYSGLARQGNPASKSEPAPTPGPGTSSVDTIEAPSIGMTLNGREKYKENEYASPGQGGAAGVPGGPSGAGGYGIVAGKKLTPLSSADGSLPGGGPAGPMTEHLYAGGQPQNPQSGPRYGERLGEWERRSLAKSLSEAKEAAAGTTVTWADGESKQKNENLDRLAAVELKQLSDEARPYRYALIAPQSGEQYAKIVENSFLNPRVEQHALSTFSIDVDTASYANVRRFLNNGQLPPPDAVRLEELVNYFKYKYPQPKGDDPFSVNMEMADCPWQPGHKLLRVGLQGKEIHRAERPASNLVFLIDTSGSMTDENKLPLLKQAFSMLVSELGENDKVTIVTYAGNAGLRLEPTRGDQKEKILGAIEGMQSGGSTHGSAGIQLAYEQAAAQFIKGGTNKVILATDGDLNVGITSDAALVDLIKQKAETGVFLTVLGVGTGNLKDAKMEGLADNGNGIYAYLDSVREARKVLVEEMSGSLVTIAKDVKIQIEFNPAQIESYRLLGYENRILAHQDFNNDKKDAGEIGAGHSVTALYEIVMVGGGEATPAAEKSPAVAPLKYQRAAESDKQERELTDVAKNGEILTLKLRYKEPEANESKLLEFPLKDQGGSFNSASGEMQFASAVVAFGLALRNSEHRGSANLSAVAEIAGAATGEDVGGHRAEFLDLVRKTKALSGK